SRPGEAIYNDANGLVEGNDLFQVVWLSEDRREEILRQLDERARSLSDRRLPLVFEGNVPSDIARNQALDRLLRSPSVGDGLPRVASAWLGEAVAIKDATAAVFRAQGGTNLVVVGQNEESALATLTASVVGLSAQHGPEALRFTLLDGT